MKPVKGLRLGERYELRTRIAIGGMGEVWVAWDQNLHREVAAKVLRTEYAGQQTFLDRLRTEARNAAGLSHQNIAAMYDYGEAQGSGFLIMEYVPGEPMSALLNREGTLEAAQVLNILAQTARGLHTAHRGGVVHRDIKPANILITPDGYVKLTDFGVSLAANQAPMTAAGMVMGTAQYLPPEQAMGKAATGAGDIYGLGVVAYEALVGERPFTGKTQVDIAFAHVREPVPALPEHLDPRVRAVVEQMLAKDPEQRPRSAASLARSLQELTDELTAPWRTGGAHEPAATSVQESAASSEPAASAETAVSTTTDDGVTLPSTATFQIKWVPVHGATLQMNTLAQDATDAIEAADAADAVAEVNVEDVVVDQMTRALAQPEPLTSKPLRLPATRRARRRAIESSRAQELMRRTKAARERGEAGHINASALMAGGALGISGVLAVLSALGRLGDAAGWLAAALPLLSTLAARAPRVKD